MVRSDAHRPIVYSSGRSRRIQIRRTSDTRYLCMATCTANSITEWTVGSRCLSSFKCSLMPLEAGCDRFMYRQGYTQTICGINARVRVINGTSSKGRCIRSSLLKHELVTSRRSCSHSYPPPSHSKPDALPISTHTPMPAPKPSDSSS